MRPLPETQERDSRAAAVAEQDARPPTALADARAFEAWLEACGFPPGERDLRRRLFHEALRAGLPTPKCEEWRYADLRSLAVADFLPDGRPQKAGAQALPEAEAPGAGVRFLDGRLAANTAGERITAWDRRTGCPTALLEAAGEHAQDGVSKLAAALATHGALITAGRGESVRVLLSSAAAGGGAHGLHELTVSAGGAVTLLVEARADAPVASERLLLRLEPGAKARVLVLQEAKAQAFGFLRVDGALAADSELMVVHLAGGAGFARAEHRWHLSGDRARAELRLLGLPGTRGHVDSLTRVHHEARTTVSRQTIRAIAAAGERVAYQGLVRVAHGADGTDSRQDAKGVLRSRGGEIDLKPELEIFADEVACAHGATVGQLDEAALFYLTSRGIPERQAERLLLMAFARDVLDGWPDDDPFAPPLGHLVDALFHGPAEDSGKAQA